MALDEYSTSGGGHEHVHAVADVLASFGRLARAAIDHAAHAKEQDTSDIFTEISRETDRWLWMVEAHRQASEWVHRRASDTGVVERHPEH